MLRRARDDIYIVIILDSLGLRLPLHAYQRRKVTDTLGNKNNYRILERCYHRGILSHETIKAEKCLLNKQVTIR